VLQVLRLGLPLGAKVTGALAEAFLFPAIVGFPWPTCGGRQCWNHEFRQVGGGVDLSPTGALRGGERHVEWKMVQWTLRASLIHSPTNRLSHLHLPFIGHCSLPRLFTIAPRDGTGTFLEYSFYYETPTRVISASSCASLPLNVTLPLGVPTAHFHHHFDLRHPRLNLTSDSRRTPLPTPN
jgi:hypothetical protein